MRIDGKEYKLCLFDTNALSGFLKEPGKWTLYFDKKFSISSTLICYSVFTLSELYYRRDLYRDYINIFSTFPSVILDGYEAIFQKEMKNYNSLGEINPIAIVPFSLKRKNVVQKKRLKYIIEKSGFIQKSKKWRKYRELILEGILSLKKKLSSKE